MNWILKVWRIAINKHKANYCLYDMEGKWIYKFCHIYWLESTK